MDKAGEYIDQIKRKVQGSSIFAYVFSQMNNVWISAMIVINITLGRAGGVSTLGLKSIKILFGWISQVAQL